MPVINCLETAKKAYKEDIDNQDIESVYDALTRHKRMAEKTGANILEEMNNFTKELVTADEHANKENLLQQLISMQAIVDNLQREELFRKAGFIPQNSVLKSMMGKMSGSTWKVTRNRDNTYSRKIQAADGFYREFAKDIQGELTPLFLSKAGQVELADAMYADRRGASIDSPYGRLAKVVLKYQDRFYTKLRALGIDITELEDRIAPNVHDAARMLKLTAAEKKSAVELFPTAGDPYYEFAFQRWNADILPLIDKDKVFKARNVDPTNAKQVEEFQRVSFDNLVNKGKVSQQSTNFANKFKKSRVYHWLDGQSLVTYNDKYGNGAIQDSILRELAHGFGMTEVIKDWGINPETTIDRTLKLFDENPIINQRTGKAEEARKLKNLMRSMITTDADYQGTVANIATGIKAWETLTKMGSVTLAATQDLYNISAVARTAGKGAFETVPTVLKNLLVGMSDADKAIVYKFVNTGISNKLGSLARFSVNPFAPTSLPTQATHWMFKLNFLERWDNGNRGYIASTVSQYFAENRSMGWDKLSDNDKGIFESYGIDAQDWDVIRQSNVKIGSRNKQFITPDSVQELTNDRVREIVGDSTMSEVATQNYKDSVERKLSTYFRDRIEQAVVNPDAYDNSLPVFGGSTTNPYMRAVLGVLTQFKKFGVAQFRRTILPILREKGATTTAEMLYGGKSNWVGISKMAVEMMLFAYVSISLKNLAQGLTPPSLDKTATWAKMIKSSAGVLELALQIDPKDVVGSLAKTVAGPALTDVAKVSKLGYYGATEAKKGHGFKNTKKASYQLLKGNIPYNTFMTKQLYNHFLLDALEDSAYPGKRQKDLRQIKKDTGAQQLF